MISYQSLVKAIVHITCLPSIASSVGFLNLPRVDLVTSLPTAKFMIEPCSVPFA